MIAILAIAGLYLLTRPFFAGPGTTAAVTLDGGEIMSVPLRENDDYRVDLMEGYDVPVSFEVKGGGIRFVDVACPDHICEKTGVICEEGQTAVCMPNRVAVVIIEN